MASRRASRVTSAGERTTWTSDAGPSRWWHQRWRPILPAPQRPFRATSGHRARTSGVCWHTVKRTTVKLPDDLDAKLRHEADRRGVTISDLTREAIEAHLGSK